MRLGGRRRARAREATPAPTDPYDRALSDLVDELRLHHPRRRGSAELHAFTLEVVNGNGRYPGIEAANWRPAVVMVTRDVRRDNESRERMSAASPAHGVCSGMDEVGGSQPCARAARGHP
jgi:hypothetical protein